MIEESLGVFRCVEWQILMDASLWQTLLGEMGGCCGACRQQEIDVWRGFQQAVHEWQDGVGFTDACRMDPHECTFGPRDVCFAEAFAAAAAIFFSLAFAYGEDGRGKGPPEACQAPVKTEL